jgi:hypothetical protein
MLFTGTVRNVAAALGMKVTYPETGETIDWSKPERWQR